MHLTHNQEKKKRLIMEKQLIFSPTKKTLSTIKVFLAEVK